MGKDSRRRLVVCPQCGRSRLTTTPDHELRWCKPCGKTKHGYAGSSLYTVWHSMLTRCGVYKNDHCDAAPHYQGRGIKVCYGWWEFEPFMRWAFENGYTDGLRLDRRNNDGDYTPDNCRWITHKEQMRNTRANRIIAAFGKSQCLQAWSDETGLDRMVITKRLRRGWPVEDALTIPSLGPGGRRKA